MDTCKICSQELKVELQPDDFDEATSSAVGGAGQTAPDDLMLACGCHFHWYVVIFAFSFSFDLLGFDKFSFIVWTVVVPGQRLDI